MKADRNLFLTADKSRVVEDGDPEQAFVLVGKGGEIPPWAVDRYGLTVNEEPVAPTEEAVPSGLTVTRLKEHKDAEATGAASDEKPAKKGKGKTK
jgi:hypothetical protein